MGDVRGCARAVYLVWESSFSEPHPEPDPTWMLEVRFLGWGLGAGVFRA